MRSCWPAARSISGLFDYVELTDYDEESRGRIWGLDEDGDNGPAQRVARYQ